MTYTLKLDLTDVQHRTLVELLNEESKRQISAKTSGSERSIAVAEITEMIHGYGEAVRIALDDID